MGLNESSDKGLSISELKNKEIYEGGYNHLNARNEGEKNARAYLDFTGLPFCDHA